MYRDVEEVLAEVQLGVEDHVEELGEPGFVDINEGLLPIPARIGQFVTWFLPGLALATLGLHYGITLHPRADVAENLYYGWLGVAVCASLMIPFMGWAVLLAGLIHSSLRLSRWRSPEVS